MQALPFPASPGARNALYANTAVSSARAPCADAQNRATKKSPRGLSETRRAIYSPQQVAAILDAAWATPERRHVHLYVMIHLGTHRRSEAILELDANQVRDDRIYFNAQGREQTRKRRSVVPIAPTLRPWLEGLDGKLIRYRTVTSLATRQAGGPEWFERETTDIGRAFEACLVAAHEAKPHLELARPAGGCCRQARDAATPPQARRKRDSPQDRRYRDPNTLRHTIHTWHQRHGVPQAQIGAAAGYSSERGSGANYTHLRPEYLSELVASTEAFWEAVGEHTSAHVRYPCDTDDARPRSNHLTLTA
jgi:hypothetical protein